MHRVVKPDTEDSTIWLNLPQPESIRGMLMIINNFFILFSNSNKSNNSYHDDSAEVNHDIIPGARHKHPSSERFKHFLFLSNFDKLLYRESE
jgi:hypothetical protein